MPLSDARIFIHNVDSYIGKALVKELRKAEGGRPDIARFMPLSLSLSRSLFLSLSLSRSLSLCLSPSLYVSLSLSRSLSFSLLSLSGFFCCEYVDLRYRRANSGRRQSC